MFLDSQLWAGRAAAGATTTGPTRDWRLSALDHYVFDLQGYLVFEHALDPGAVDRLRSVIDAQSLPPLTRPSNGSASAAAAACSRGTRPSATCWTTRWRWQCWRSSIGPYVRLDHAYGIAMRPGTSGLGLHGPAEPFDSSQYYVHRMGVIRNGLVSLSWSLSDGVAGDGGFGCIPGSHRASSPLPPGAESLVVEVPQSAGSLLVFTEALVHCTIPWQGTSTRQAVLYKYSPGSTAWDPSPGVSPDVVASMSSATASLLPARLGWRAASDVRVLKDRAPVSTWWRQVLPSRP